MAVPRAALPGNLADIDAARLGLPAGRRAHADPDVAGGPLGGTDLAWLTSASGAGPVSVWQGLRGETGLWPVIVDPNDESDARGAPDETTPANSTRSRSLTRHAR